MPSYYWYSFQSQPLHVVFNETIFPYKPEIPSDSLSNCSSTVVGIFRKWVDTSLESSKPISEPISLSRSIEPSVTESSVIPFLHNKSIVQPPEPNFQPSKSTARTGVQVDKVSHSQVSAEHSLSCHSVGDEQRVSSGVQPNETELLSDDVNKQSTIFQHAAGTPTLEELLRVLLLCIV
ncbi:hypothetical protein NE237_014984 [Protea cynaroides]|uniref:Uncharacterized protein n=1 Tax=Protea cynaroides TaxID=273540 RepID=A0A9Q0KCZ6_9MAGN|nr:hypothetical protein NE237_014984 [Protea cynaroides]